MAQCRDQNWHVTIVLAGPPRGKGRPRFSKKTARAFTPKETQTYEAQLRYAGFEAMSGRPPLEGPLEIRITAMVPIPKSWSKKKTAAAQCGEVRPVTKPDGDNLAKMVDGLNELVWRDDSQICQWDILKFYSDKPALIIQVRPADTSGGIHRQILEDLPADYVGLPDFME